MTVYSLKYLLNLRNFIGEKIPGDGTLVSQHVGVGTVFHDLLYSILFSEIVLIWEINSCFYNGGVRN